MAHFDFVVHDRLDGENPTHPLFAVEFDGRSTHAGPEDHARDRRKNRLCAASGLPLMRIGEEFLHKREQLSTIARLAQLWAYHHEEMPGLLAERDADVDRLPEAERDSPWLLGEHPELDVNLVFGARHPFPAVSRLAHPCRRIRFHLAARRRRARRRGRCAVGRRVVLSSRTDLKEGLVQLWTCEAMVRGPPGAGVKPASGVRRRRRTEDPLRGFARMLTGRAQVHTGYPVYDDDRVVGWNKFLRGQLPCLPAGPWTGAPALLGEALSTHNLLVNVGHAIKRDHRRNAPPV